MDKKSSHVTHDSQLSLDAGDVQLLQHYVQKAEMVNRVPEGE
jgi:hypothetical protein